MRGQRFELDFDLDPELDPDRDLDDEQPPPKSSSSFLRDIIEKSTRAPQAPSPPSTNDPKTGFPLHKRWSKFADQARSGRQGRAAATLPSKSTLSTTTSGRPKMAMIDEEKRAIDEENRRRLEEMSPEEIEEERRQLLGALRPSLVARLMNRKGNENVHEEAEELMNTPKEKPKERKSKEIPVIQVREEGKIYNEQREREAGRHSRRQEE